MKKYLLFLAAFLMMATLIGCSAADDSTITGPRSAVLRSEQSSSSSNSSNF